MLGLVSRCLVLLSLTAGGAACTGGGSPTVVPPTRSDPYVQSSAAACPTTAAEQPPFVPLPPYPAAPPGGPYGFWYGSRELWTALPGNGQWGQLALGEKFWWWSEEFDARAEPVPALVVTARRLDGPSPVYRAGPATHGWSSDLYEAMLVWIDLPADGCWELIGEYRGHRLTVVVWVP